MFNYFAGCDTHKAKHHITVINKQGERLESLYIENNLNGWIKALTVFQKYDDIICGIENHANYGKLFSKFLIKNNIPLREVNPIFTGKKRVKHTKRNKTDEIDSLVIAKITRDEYKYLPVIIADEGNEGIKAIVKQRENAMKDKVRLVNRLHSKLIQLDTSYKIRYGNSLSRITVIELVNNDFIHNKDTLSQLILKDINRLKILIKEIEDLEKMMEDYSKNNLLIQNLKSIPGVKIIRACQLVALIGNISKYKKVDKFISYSGMAPIKYASGNYSKDFKNNGGRKVLKTLIKDIAKTQKRYNEEANRYFDKKIREGKSEKEARIALQSQITKIIYFVYKKNEPYKYTRTKSKAKIKVA